MPPPQFREDALPLDATLFSMSPEEVAFYRQQTGIESEESLKDHILEIQAEAYSVVPYPCIRRFDFIRLKISQHPYYQNFLKLGAEGKGIFLDVGCCFGNDVRKAISDGYPKGNVLATDLRQEFWDLGHKLFKTTPETFHVPFLCGDIFSDTLYDTKSTTSDSPPPLSSLQSLTPLKGHVSTIHTAALFHLFDEQQQEVLGRRLASLLSPNPGSVIFGSHVSRPVKGVRKEAAGLGALAGSMFCHSDSSWAALWDGVVFPRGTVRVDGVLEEFKRPDIERTNPGMKYYQLNWCITKL